MATIQDIRALELRICEAVEEYLGARDAYDRPVLHVYLDKDRMVYCVEMDDNLEGGEDDGFYAVEGLVRDGDEGPELDIDNISDIANSWIFLD